MQLTIAALKDKASFTGRPIPKTIRWEQNGDMLEAETYVRPLGYQAAVSDLLAVNGRQDAVAGRIAACICDENGQPVFTVDDILLGPKDAETGERLGALDGKLTVALLNAIGEVANLGKTQS